MSLRDIIREKIDAARQSCRDKKQKKAEQKAKALEKCAAKRFDPYGATNDDAQQKQAGPNDDPQKKQAEPNKTGEEQVILQPQGNTKIANIMGNNNRLFSLFARFVNKVEFGIPEEDRKKLVQAMTKVVAGCAEDVKRSMMCALERKQVDSAAQEEAIGKLVMGLLEQQLVDLKAYSDKAIDDVADVVEKKCLELSDKCDEICAALADNDVQKNVENLAAAQGSMNAALAEVLAKATDSASLAQEILSQNDKIEKAMTATRNELEALMNSVEICVQKEGEIENMVAENLERSMQNHQEQIDKLDDIQLLGGIALNDIRQVKDDVDQLRPFIADMVGQAVAVLLSKIDVMHGDIKGMQNDIKGMQDDIAILKQNFDVLLQLVKEKGKVGLTSEQGAKDIPKEISALMKEVSAAENWIKRSTRPNDAAAKEANKIISRVNAELDKYIEEEVMAINEEIRQRAMQLVDKLCCYLKSIALSGIYNCDIDELISMSETIMRLNGWILMKGLNKFGAKCADNNVEFSQQLNERINNSIQIVQRTEDNGEDSLGVAGEETDNFEKWLHCAMQLN